MKKRRKIIRRLSFLLCFCLIAAMIPAYIYWEKGNMDDVTLPQNFQEETEMDAFANSADVRIMSSNLLVHYESWGGTPAKPRAKKYAEILQAYKPDVVGIQELCDSWYCLVNRNMPDGYKMLFPLSTGAFVNMTAMIYNSNTLDLIDSGKFAYAQGDNIRLRRVVWAVFEVKETGAKFAVTNTHFDLLREGQEEELSAVMHSQADELIHFVNELAEDYGCPVFSVGDYNSMEDRPYTKPINIPEIYNTLADEFEDARYNSKKTVDGTEQDWDSISFDHIFYKGEAEIDTFAVLSYEYLTDMSDHYPIFADIKLNR
ncbi:MAG: hypothetical protein NC397_05235 [Clostridium sp.]|nr:hypothetical protein [Clostridium sp.]